MGRGWSPPGVTPAPKPKPRHSSACHTHMCMYGVQHTWRLSHVPLSHRLLPVPAGLRDGQCSSAGRDGQGDGEALPGQPAVPRSAVPALGWLKSGLGNIRSHFGQMRRLPRQPGCLCASTGPSRTRRRLGPPVLAGVGSTGHNSARQQTATRPVQGYISAWEQFVSVFHLYHNITKDRRSKTEPSVQH